MTVPEGDDVGNGSGDGTADPGGGSPGSNPLDSWAAIVRDGLDIWLTQGQTWNQRSRTHPTWSPEDVVGDSNNLVEHMTPLAERSLNLTIELLRPWARAFEGRTQP